MHREEIKDELNDHSTVIQRMIQYLITDIEVGCSMINNTFLAGNKLFLAGNGGSAADAQHLASEFTGRFQEERLPLPAIALTTDSSALTAIGNDYGFDKVFNRQLQALGTKNDLVIAISTSGNSSNIISLLQAANEMGCQTIGLTGKNGGEVTKYCNLNIIVPSDITARIQEAHILIGHIFCKSVDKLFILNDR